MTPRLSATCSFTGLDAYPCKLFARSTNGRALMDSTLGEVVTIHTRTDIATPPPLPAIQKRRQRDARRDNASSRYERFSHYLARPILRIGPFAYAAAVTTVLGIAWWQRDEGHLTAESGIGYWLGIVGAILILVLITYPLRKRLKSFQRFGKVANWFRFHMIIGILAPALIVLHTNFKLGSLNSRLALLTMLIVVTSGIVGRYLYAKVHKGLYGRQLALREVHADIIALKQNLCDAGPETARVDAELETFIREPQAHPSVLKALLSSLTAGFTQRSARRSILKMAKRDLADSPRNRNLSGRQRRQFIKDADNQLRLFFAAVRKAERFALFESLLGMWHHLHMPLFIMLFLTVVIHIIAVHLY